MTPKRGATDDIHRTDKRARTDSASSSSIGGISGSDPRHGHSLTLPAMPSRPQARIQPEPSSSQPPQGAVTEPASSHILGNGLRRRAAAPTPVAPGPGLELEALAATTTAAAAEVVRLVLPTSGRDDILPDDPHPQPYPQTQTRGVGRPQPHQNQHQHRVDEDADDDDDEDDVDVHPAEAEYPVAPRRAPAPAPAPAPAQAGGGRWAGLPLDGDDLSDAERQRRAVFNSNLLEQQATERRDRNREYARVSRRRRADLVVQLQAENARLEALTRRLQAEAEAEARARARDRDERGEGLSVPLICSRCRAAIAVPARRSISIDDEIEEFLLNEQQHRQQQQSPSPPPVPLVAAAVAAAAGGLDDLVAGPDVVSAQQGALDVNAQQPDNLLLAGDNLDMQLWNNFPAGDDILLAPADEGQNEDLYHHHHQADDNLDLVAWPPPVVDAHLQQSALVGGGSGGGGGESIIGGEGHGQGHVEADGFWEGFDWDLGTWGGNS